MEPGLELGFCNPLVIVSLPPYPRAKEMDCNEFLSCQDTC